MALESASFISQLVSTNPVGGTDDYATADDHLRLIKAVLLNQFPNFTAAQVTATVAELNTLDGITSTTAELNALDGYTGDVNDLNILSGAAVGGLTAAELLYLANVTSDIQTQLDNRSLTGHTHPAADIVSGTLAIAQGGTNAATAAAARTSLGVAIGSDVQAWDADLDALAALTTQAFGRGFLEQLSASTARTYLGLGTMATQSSTLVNIGGGTIANIVDLAVADGGTGASDAATARTNLGLGTANTPQFTGVEVGHASDTTLTRQAAGQLAIEGDAVFSHEAGVATYPSAKIHISNGVEPTTEGANGDIFLVY